MKKSLLILLIVRGFELASAQSRTDSMTVRNNIVKLSPLSLLVGDVSLFYERVLTQRTSMVGGIGFGSESFSYSRTPSPGQFHYERLTIEYRYYLSRRHRAPIGAYVGIYSRFARLTLIDYVFDEKGDFIIDSNGQFVKPTQQLNMLIPGGMVGIQATPKRVVIDLFFGLQYQLPNSNTVLRSVVPELMSRQGLAPRYGLTIGYRF